MDDGHHERPYRVDPGEGPSQKIEFDDDEIDERRVLLSRLKDRLGGGRAESVLFAALTVMDETHLEKLAVMDASMALVACSSYKHLVTKLAKICMQI
jgi:hypothetical protein